MSIVIVRIEEFLKHAEVTPVIDVRSPSEYEQGHIPGAVNIPVFEDKEREAVGIMYKKEGREQAIMEGLRQVGPSLASKLQRALDTAKDGKILVHCWRGGMRSESMAWLFSLAGLEVRVLEDGYKAYRRHVLSSLSGKMKMIVLGGMTGSSKTHILRHLKTMGEQVIDLEALACHKGSAFGALGQPAQPKTEHFSNLLFTEWMKLDKTKPVWVEDESRNIGTVFIPDEFYLNMQDSRTIVIEMDVKTRLPRLISEYASYPPEELKESIMRISKRLGGDNTQMALEAVDKGNISEAIVISLNYYDKAYQFGLKKKNSKNLIYVRTATDDIRNNALMILDAARNIQWQ